MSRKPARAPSRPVPETALNDHNIKEHEEKLKRMAQVSEDSPGMNEHNIREHEEKLRREEERLRQGRLPIHIRSVHFRADGADVYYRILLRGECGQERIPPPSFLHLAPAGILQSGQALRSALRMISDRSRAFWHRRQLQFVSLQAISSPPISDTSPPIGSTCNRGRCRLAWRARLSCCGVARSRARPSRLRGAKGSDPSRVPAGR